jgi:hypothetical protein
MIFSTYAAQTESLHLAWLESGRQDEAALTHGIEAAYQAIESLPPGQLTARQQRQWRNLAGIYEDRSPAGKTWYPEHRQGWFEDALELVREVQP